MDENPKRHWFRLRLSTVLIPPRLWRGGWQYIHGLSFGGLEMDDGPTFASITNVTCTCGYLQRAADELRNPIVFDAATNEYQFTYREPECKGLSMLVIYHCPFCGGAAPKSKRDLLFALISPEEEARLLELLRPVNTVRSALKRLGRPDRDDSEGTSVRQSELDGEPPYIQHFRTLVYKNLSEVADVLITERADGKVYHRLQGKYVGDRRSSIDR